jgi:HTH-type transcriptional regulator/antitoxin HigA
LFEQQIVYVKHITTHSEYDKLCRRYAKEAEYQEALAMVDKLIDDFDNNIALIERLTDAIEEWESAFKEFSEFNAGVQSQDAVEMRWICSGSRWTSTNLVSLTYPKSAASRWLPGYSTARDATLPAAISRRSPNALG